jgi:hypothetical protein
VSLPSKIPSPLGGGKDGLIFHIERTHCGRALLHSLTWATASVIESSAAATSVVERDDWWCSPRDELESDAEGNAGLVWATLTNLGTWFATCRHSAVDKQRKDVHGTQRSL